MFTRDLRYIHCLYFIHARKIYVRTHVKITRLWKSTHTLPLHYLRVSRNLPYGTNKTVHT